MTAAEVLADHRLARRALDRLPGAVRPGDEAAAYAVQDELHERLTAAGRGAVVARKIGCTTPVMQDYLGIANPCAGGIFEPTIHHSPATVAQEDHLRLGVECEIAVLLESNLDRGPFDHEHIAAAVGGCMAAIEIVEDRYVDYPALDTPTLIADDFFNAGCVLGEADSRFDPRRLDRVWAAMEIGGRQVGAGRGSDILEHPLDALAWLAESSARRGRPLKAGEHVLLGSLVQTNWIARDDEVVVRNDPFGEVRMRLM